MVKQINAAQREVQPLVLSVRQTAVALNVSPRLVVELIRGRKIERLKVGGRRMVPEKAIADYVERGVKEAAAIAT